jgi:glycogen operon protein
MNGENNFDGESYNRSWNCGIEGPTNDVHVNRFRDCQKRNFLTTLFLSQGIPMLVAGLSMFLSKSISIKKL